MLPCKWKKAAEANSSGSRVLGMRTSAARWNRCWRITVKPAASSRRRHLLTRARPPYGHAPIDLRIQSSAWGKPWSVTTAFSKS